MDTILFPTKGSDKTANSANEGESAGPNSANAKTRIASGTVVLDVPIVIVIKAIFEPRGVLNRVPDGSLCIAKTIEISRNDEEDASNEEYEHSNHQKLLFFFDEVADQNERNSHKNANV